VDATSHTGLLAAISYTKFAILLFFQPVIIFEQGRGAEKNNT